MSDGAKRSVPTIGRHSDPCKICNKSVFILERLHVSGRILHRTCFKCARCGTQLSLAGYYETETAEYCCELCPDEEHREKQKQETLKPNLRSEQEEEEVDSGHSSEDSKDIDDDEDEEKDESSEKPIVCELPIGVKPSAETEGKEDDVELSDVNANIEKLTIPAENSFNNNTQSSNICSEVDIDVNDNAVDTCSEKEILMIAKNLEKNLTDDDNVEYPDENNPFDDDEDEDVNDSKDNATGQTIDENVTSVDLTDGIQPENYETNKSLNPFGEFDDEDEAELDKPNKPVHSSQQELLIPEAKLHNSSLNPFGADFSSDEEQSLGSVSPSTSVRSQSRQKKKRRAPLPPGSKSSTPLPPESKPCTPVPAPRSSLTPAQQSQQSSPASAEAAKRIKDERNMNRRSQILESIKNESVRIELPTIPSDSCLMITSDTSQSESASINQSDTLSLMSASTTTTQSSGPSYLGASQVFSPIPPDKADEGQWRKKKGPAPPRPIPPRRAVRKLHRKAINQELEDIEVKQGELERQGVKLEKTIREICDKSDEEGENRDSLGPEAEDLIIQLFDLVNEKNELFRRQTELIYMKKDNRLEEQHADLEYQIRILMSKPEGQKTDEELKKEEKLIKKLVEVVGLRNEIVDCLELDRLRERDEDTAIEDHMSNYAAVKPVEEPKKTLTKMLRIKKKKKKDRDSEKDVDTSEIQDPEELTSTEKKKKSTKKKLLSYASKKLTFPH